MRVSVIKIWFVLVCVVMCFQPVAAATKLTPEIYHFLGFWGAVGYEGWLFPKSEIRTMNTVSPQFGVGYRYMRNNFVLQTGLEGQYMRINHKVEDKTYTPRMHDADIPNEEFTMHISLFDFTDVSQLVSLNIPLDFGYEKKRFYMMGGVKAGFLVYGNALNKATMTTLAGYDSYIGSFENLPNHGLSTTNLTSGKTPLRMKVNLMVHAEIGVRLDRIEDTGFKVKPHNYRIYLGAFAEYGVLNTHYANSTTPMVAFDYSRGVNATLTPFMLSSESAGAELHPLTAGIKLTMMFKLPERGKSYNYDSKDQKPGGFRKRGGNQSLQ